MTKWWRQQNKHRVDIAMPATNSQANTATCMIRQLCGTPPACLGIILPRGELIWGLVLLVPGYSSSHKKLNLLHVEGVITVLPHVAAGKWDPTALAWGGLGIGIKGPSKSYSGGWNSGLPQPGLSPRARQTDSGVPHVANSDGSSEQWV